MAHVFISYATPDRGIADEVMGWLQTAGHDPFLAHNLRSGISVGEDWKQRLYRELRQVDALIGVVTSAFVASSWCSAEVGIADALGCRLLPLRAEAGVVHPLMSRLQYVDYQADRQQARERVLQAVRLLDDDSGMWREGDNPFPGLEPFTAALGRVFFARASETRDISNRLRSMGHTGGILVIVGASGSGKSSLLNAGVIPLLERDPAWLVVPALMPGTDPVAELARVLAATARRLGLVWSASDVRGKLEGGTDGLRRIADDLLAAAPSAHQRRLVVTVDQAEELFTRTPPNVRQRFTQLLREAVTGPVQVLGALRSEFLADRRLLYPELTGVRMEAYLLDPLNREMLRDVIEQPARVARLRLEEGLAAALVADTGSGEALPLLAFTLRQLADGLAPGDTLTLARYHDLGGVHGALARHADAALAEAVRVSGLTEREVLAGLTRLVTVAETGRRARRRITLNSLPDSLRVALQVFVERRLLLSDTDDAGQVWLTVVHEALLTEWKPLDTATAEIISALRAAREVEQAAADWNSAGRSEHYLWDHERLTTTLATLGMTGDGRNPITPPIVTLDDHARAFLDATAQHVHVYKEHERRRRTRTITMLSSLLVLALMGAGIAVWQRQSVISAQRAVIAQAMLAQADRIRDSDPRLALQFGVAAQQFDASPQTQASLRQTLDLTSHLRTLRGHTGAVQGVAFAPNGQTLATVSADGTIRLWDLSNRDHPHQLGLPLTGHTNEVHGVAFAPDGRTLASGSFDKTVRLWDLSNRDHPQQLGPPLTGHTDAVAGVAFSPDGRTLASTSFDKTVRLWDLSIRDQPHQLGSPLIGHTSWVHGVAFAPDGRTLATASGDRTVRLWDLSTRDQPHQLGPPLIGHISEVHDVAFAPDGRTLATASGDQTVKLWDLSDRDQPHQLGPPLIGHTGAVWAVAFGPDGHSLATGSLDQTAALWDLNDQPRQLGPPLTGHTGAVHGVTFSPDGHTLATTSDDHTIRLWDLSEPHQSHPLGPPLTGHTDAVNAVAFSPDGRTLATTSDDHTVRRWDLSDRNQPRQLGPPLTAPPSAVSGVAAFGSDGHTLATVSGGVRLWDFSNPSQLRQVGPTLTDDTGTVFGVAFSPDGRTLATANLDQTVKLWDLSDRNQPRQLGPLLTGHTNWVYAVAFAPDGRSLASASDDRTIRLWDLSDHNRPQPLTSSLRGHTDAVFGIAFAPDGRTLASASGDRTIRLWDLSDHNRPHPLGPPLTGHTGAVFGVAFAPNGHILATVSNDQNVILWELPRRDTFAGSEIQEACLRTGGPLDKATWDQYASSINYQDTCVGL